MMKNFKRSTKGLSPIFATLILIAIAVIAGIVVYMFSSGYIAQLTGSGPAVTEKAAVQGVSVSNSTVYATYVAGPDNIVITGAILKTASGSTANAVGVTGGTLLKTGELAALDVTGLFEGATVGDTYTVTLTSSKGGSFVSASFIIPAA